MATLEIHDGRGRVEFVTVSLEHPALIGSDPKCDVVVSDPSVLPYHARLRWRKGRFKVEAFPDAKTVEVNGQKAPTGRFGKGDELIVGGHKLFLVEADDAPAGSESVATEVDARRERKSRSRGLRQEASATPAPAFEAVSEASATPGTAIKPPKVAIWRRAFRKLNSGGAPGQDDLTKSPLILGLGVILGTLLLVGYGLWNLYNSNRARAQYALAESAFQQRDYPAALAQFDIYLDENPGHRRSGEARVLRALSKVRQFTVKGGQSWSAAIANAEEMVETVGNEPVYQQGRRMDLAQDVLAAAQGFAEIARRTSNAEALADAKSAIVLHEQIADAAHNTLLNRSDVPETLKAAEAAVLKAKVRKDALAAMSKAIAAETPDPVFAGRDALVRTYPDLAADRELIARLTEANELVRKAVSFEEVSRKAATDPQPDPLGPPVSLVLRTAPLGGRPAPATEDGPVAYALVQGYAYGVDATNGAPLWHVPVGMTSPYPPLAVGGSSPSALVLDARHDELLRLDGRTGELKWRQPLGESATGLSPPLVLGNQVLQVLPSGKVLYLDLNSGTLRGILNVNRPLAGTPAVDEAGQYFYFTGDRDSIYVVARDPVECVSVAYLGHPSGSIRSAPARLADFLIVPENRDLWEGRWSVFALDDQGATLRLLQTTPIAGWTWETPPSQGTIVWSMTDRNAITAFVLGSSDMPEPLSRIAQTTPDVRPSGPAYAYARGDRELWISSNRFGRYDVESEHQTLSPTWTIERAGPAVGPIQLAGRIAVFSHQFDEGPGVALWGMDPSNGRIAWKTVLGAPWAVPPSPTPDGGSLNILAMDRGPEAAITPALLASGGFLEQPLRNPGYFYLPEGPLRWLRHGGLSILVPEPQADYLLVREGPSGEFQRVDLPAPLGAAPVLWGDDLFIPGLDGRAYLVDPRTGAPEAEPYVPIFDAEEPTRWLDPTVLGDSVILADRSGKVRRLEKKTDPRVMLDVAGVVEDLRSPIEADPAAVGDATYFATEDHRVRALDAKDLGSLNTWSLDVPLSYGPIALGDQVLLVDKGGAAWSFGPDGERRWIADLGDAPPIGAPVILDDALWFLSRDGVLQQVAVADGSSLDRAELGILPSGGLKVLGNDVVVFAAPGTVRRLGLGPESGSASASEAPAASEEVEVVEEPAAVEAPAP